MRTTVKYIDKFLTVFACIFTLAYVGVVLIQIFSRTFLPKTPSWTEEVARYSFIYAVAFAGGLAVRANAYVAVDIVVSHIPEKFERLYHIILNLLLCAFATFFEVRSVFKFAFLKARLVSTALELPMQYIYFGLVILFGSLSICYLLETIMLITGQTPDEGAPVLQGGSLV